MGSYSYAHFIAEMVLRPVIDHVCGCRDKSALEACLFDLFSVPRASNRSAFDVILIEGFMCLGEGVGEFFGGVNFFLPEISRAS